MRREQRQCGDCVRAPVIRVTKWRRGVVNTAGHFVCSSEGKEYAYSKSLVNCEVNLVREMPTRCGSKRIDRDEDQIVDNYGADPTSSGAGDRANPVVGR